MQTEEEVREVWAATQREKLVAWRDEMRAKGWPDDVIERLAQLTEQLSAAHLERNLPLILRDLAITSGEASLH